MSDDLVIAKPPEAPATSKKRKRPKSVGKKGKKKKGLEGSKPAKKMTWTNKQRALVFAARGITFHARHLMNDLKVLMPHAKSGVWAGGARHSANFSYLSPDILGYQESAFHHF